MSDQIENRIYSPVFTIWLRSAVSKATPVDVNVCVDYVHAHNFWCQRSSHLLSRQFRNNGCWQVEESEFLASFSLALLASLACSAISMLHKFLVVSGGR